MFEWLEYHVTNGVGKMYCKICRKYERIGTFITGCRTFKIESIRSHNMSNDHTKNTLNLYSYADGNDDNNNKDDDNYSDYNSE